MVLQMIRKIIAKWRAMSEDIEAMRFALGRIESQLPGVVNMKVYSQFNEDGILQSILKYLPCDNKIFIEFGVENYLQSNTRFLLQNDNWSGIVIDGSEENVRQILESKLHTFYGLDAYSLFIDRDNINDFLKSKLDGRKCDLLSIDIDGNDYWVWEKIECCDPKIVVIEYNSLYGSSADCSMRYKYDFVRSEEKLYFYGASFSALLRLGHQKGYQLVRCNNNGNNMFFVKKQFFHLLPEYLIDNTMVEQTFREFRSSKDRQRYNTYQKRLEKMKSEDVHVFGHE